MKKIVVVIYAFLLSANSHASDYSIAATSFAGQETAPNYNSLSCCNSRVGECLSRSVEYCEEQLDKVITTSTDARELDAARCILVTSFNNNSHHLTYDQHLNYFKTLRSKNINLANACVHGVNSATWSTLETTWPIGTYSQNIKTAILDLIVQDGGNVNQVYYRDRYPIYNVLSLETLHFFIDHDAKLHPNDSQQYYGSLYLELASKVGSYPGSFAPNTTDLFAMMKELVEKHGFDPKETSPKYNESALYLALANGLDHSRLYRGNFYEIVNLTKFYIEHGGDLSKEALVETFIKRALLSWAKFRPGMTSDSEVFELLDILLANGANPNHAKSAYGQTALGQLLNFESAGQFAQYQHEWPNQTGHSAEIIQTAKRIIHYREQLLTRLLGAGAKPDLKLSNSLERYSIEMLLSSINGLNGLTFDEEVLAAVEDDMLVLVDDLLKHGANPDLHGYKKPIDLAEALGWKKVKRLLKQYRAK